jgi:hypothetical protein
MSFDLDAVYSRPKPFAVEIEGVTISGKYNGSICTPEWVAESQEANRRDDFDFCKMLGEDLLDEWNVEGKPPRFKPTVPAQRDPDTREVITPERPQVYSRGSLCQHAGKVLRALNEGKAGEKPPEPVVETAKGDAPEGGAEAVTGEPRGAERLRSGEVEFEVVGTNTGEGRPVPLTAWNLMRVPIAITGAVYRQCIANHQRGVSDEEQGKS